MFSKIVHAIGVLLSLRLCHQVHSFTPTLPKATTAVAKSTFQRFSSSDDASTTNVDENLSDIAFVLLAGGSGSRMKANMPKQFLELKGMPILHHSLDLFLNQLPAYAEEKGIR